MAPNLTFRRQSKMDGSQNLAIRGFFDSIVMGGSERRQGEAELFVVADRLRRLSDLGDQLVAFRAAVYCKMFRSELKAALAYSYGAQGGRHDPSHFAAMNCCHWFPMNTISHPAVVAAYPAAAAAAHNDDRSLDEIVCRSRTTLAHR